MGVDDWCWLSCVFWLFLLDFLFLLRFVYSFFDFSCYYTCYRYISTLFLQYIFGWCNQILHLCQIQLWHIFMNKWLLLIWIITGSKVLLSQMVSRLVWLIPIILCLILFVDTSHEFNVFIKVFHICYSVLVFTNSVVNWVCLDIGFTLSCRDAVSDCWVCRIHV